MAFQNTTRCHLVLWEVSHLKSRMKGGWLVTFCELGT